MHHTSVVKAIDKLFQVYFTKLTEGQDRAYPEPTAQGSQQGAAISSKQPVLLLCELRELPEGLHTKVLAHAHVMIKTIDHFRMSGCTCVKALENDTHFRRIILEQTLN